MEWPCGDSLKLAPPPQPQCPQEEHCVQGMGQMECRLRRMEQATERLLGTSREVTKASQVPEGAGLC